MKRASKIKRLLSLTLAMACLFAVVAIPQVSAETADNPFVYVPAPNGGYVLSEVAAGEAAPRAALPLAELAQRKAQRFHLGGIAGVGI